MICEDYIINALVEDAGNYVRKNGYALYVLGKGNGGFVTPPEDVDTEIIYVSVKNGRVSKVIGIV